MELERRSVLKAMLGTGLVPLGGGARAALPSSLVRVLVGFPAGGGTDVMGRVIVEKLRQRGSLKNVIVENRAGVSGILACEALKNATPDGTTILFAPSASTVMPVLTYRRLPYDPRTDFAALTLTGTLQSALAVSPALPVHSFQDYLAWVKADPRRGSFGTTALGSSTHFFGLTVGAAFGLPMEPVGYRGAAPLVADLTGGHIPAGTGGLADFLTHHESGKLRVILTSGTRRATSAPNIPTLAEMGHPQRATQGFYAFFAPAGTPRPVVEALSAEVAAATIEPEVRSQLLALGLEPEVSSPEALAKLLREDIETWRPVIEASGFKAD
ncbi:tripartite tricarboxylate transporter substrate-binding protein [Belnapia moabensis]|uniref:tripartite tricarboxylate transporter substrate-binding protein n=1 Tax=Belnapia moabensis TaxID=365533 RepID=UPI000694038A|nr:tripartite tricarboxylate transporter substrate-binding protein [Belnapia moabensis]